MAETVRFLKPADLRATVRGTAILAALFDKHRDCRFWSDAARGADVGLWSDPGGHDAFFLFAPAGTVLLGFDSESPMNPAHFAVGATDPKAWPGIYDEMPRDLYALVEANPFGEKFRLSDVTFAIWNQGKGFDWKKGAIQYPERELGDPDGADYLLGRFRDFFDNFEEEAAETYRKEFDPDLLYKVFADEPLTVEDLRKLKPDLSVAKVRPALQEIGVTV